jgi:hypothetical protein
MRPATRATDEYMRLSGKASYEPYYHPTRRCYVAAERVDIGRPDGVNARTGEEQMAHEPFERAESVPDRIECLLAKTGPMTARNIADALGIQRTAADFSMRNSAKFKQVGKEDTVMLNGRRRMVILWGLR